MFDEKHKVHPSLQSEAMDRRMLAPIIPPSFCKKKMGGQALYFASYINILPHPPTIPPKPEWVRGGGDWSKRLLACQLYIFR